MVDRLAWHMVRFTGPGGGPAYVDLGEVAAVLEGPPPDADKVLDVVRAGIIVLRSGRAVHVSETAETIFEEVHRYNTQTEPPKKPMKLSASAPADDGGAAAPHPE